ncbi:MAG: hypothetical protein EOM68_07850 [Spirochaetia bacterium]|nr:hypothetical protein [Spirochaetia bacterium]
MIETIEDYNRARALLITLKPEQLADALLTLVLTSRSAELLVTSLISTTAENIALFKETLHSVQHDDLGEELTLDMLRRVLDMLDPAAMDARCGLELMALFYETDEAAFASSQNLAYEFGQVYADDGVAKFTEFARRCGDKDFVRQLVQRLVSEDSYGMRMKLWDAVLPETIVGGSFRESLQ